MKTTENISLAGYSFTIENDAYLMLGTYLNDIRNSFSEEEGADEIAADIEERIAELLKERCTNGMTVNIQMIEEIRRRIGDPKDLANDDRESGEGSAETGCHDEVHTKKSWKTKRMFRDIDHRVIGGVCSGLSEYFGLDRVLIRIAFLILTFVTIFGPQILFPVVLYICLWIAIPAARTDEQKREMRGRPVNLENYRQKDFDFGKEVKDVAESPAGRTIRRAGGIFLGLILLLSGLSGTISSVLIPSLPVIISHEIADEVEEWGPLDAEEQALADIFLSSDTFWILLLVIGGIACLWFIYNGIMLLFDLKYPSWHPGLILFIAWLISIFVALAWLLKTLAEMMPTFLFW